MRTVNEFPHEVIEEENVFIPVTDGLHLAARIWRPKGSEDAPEAWEEGGVSDGKPAKRALGHFQTVKRDDHGAEMRCETHVYPIEVRETQPDFPESDQRDPTWVSINTAIGMVEERGLKDILAEFAEAKAGKS